VLSFPCVARTISLGRIGLSRSKASTRSSAAFDCAKNASRSIPLLGGPNESALVEFTSDPFVGTVCMPLRVSSSSEECEMCLCAGAAKSPGAA
jgi:hypothetical protein